MRRDYLIGTALAGCKNGCSWLIQRALVNRRLTKAPLSNLNEVDVIHRRSDKQS